MDRCARLGRHPRARRSRGTLIGQVFAAAVVGALFGPVLGGIASVAGTPGTFGAVAGISGALAAWALVTPGGAEGTGQRAVEVVRALADRRVLISGWFVVLPALLFGTLSVLAPLRLSALGFGGVAIGAVFLCSAAFETGEQPARRPRSPTAAARSSRSSSASPGRSSSPLLLPLPHDAWLLAVLVVCGGLAFGTFFTPGMTVLANVAERRGLQRRTARRSSTSPGRRDRRSAPPAAARSPTRRATRCPI